MISRVIILIIFFFTYYLIITGKSKNSVAAFSMGILTLIILRHENMTIRNISYFVDFNMLGVLFGKMIIESTMKQTGVFQAIAGYLVIKSKGSFLKIFISTIITIAFLSTFLDNVTTLLLFTPVVILICREARINPSLFIFPIIYAANIGGIFTIIGDYPNLLISSITQKGFIEFTSNIFIPVFISLSLIIIYFIISEKEIRKVNPERFHSLLKIQPRKAITDEKLLKQCLVILFIVVLGIVFYKQIGVESSLIALAGGAVTILISKKNFKQVAINIEWDTLFFFFGFFTIIKALEKTEIIYFFTENISSITSSSIGLILIVLWFSGIFSSIIGAIPITTLMIPSILVISETFPFPNELWWALVLGSGFGANFTINASISNVVVSGMIESNFKGVLSFSNFIKKGIIVSIIGLTISSIYLIIRYFYFL